MSRGEALKAARKQKRPAEPTPRREPSKKARPAVAGPSAVRREPTILQALPATIPVPASPAPSSVPPSPAPSASARPATPARTASMEREGSPATGDSGPRGGATATPTQSVEIVSGDPTAPVVRAALRPTASEGGAGPSQATVVGRRGYADFGTIGPGVAFQDPTAARKVLGALRLTADWRAMSQLDFFRVSVQSNCTLYKLLHEHAVLQHAAEKSAGTVVRLTEELAGERQATEKALDRLSRAQEREGRYKEAAAVFKTEVDELTSRLGEAGRAAQKQKRHEEARYKALTATSTKYLDLYKKYKTKYRKKKNKIEGLVRAAKMAASRAADDIALAAVKAVNDYKASDLHEAAMVQAGVESYSEGIQVTLGRVHRRYPDLDLDNLESDEEEEEEGEVGELEAVLSDEGEDAGTAGDEGPSEERVTITAAVGEIAAPVAMPSEAAGPPLEISPPDTVGEAATPLATPPEAVDPSSDAVGGAATPLATPPEADGSSPRLPSDIVDLD